MQMMFKKQIGKEVLTFVVEGDTFFDLVQEKQKLSFFDVYKCGLCASDNLYLRSYVTEKEKYEYVIINCAMCKAKVTFGKSKEHKDTFFLRRNDKGDIAWEEYKTQDKKEDEQF